MLVELGPWAGAWHHRHPDRLSRTSLILALLLAGVVMLAGCRRDNGLPSDLTHHLAGQGIAVTPVRVHAPLSSRGGYVAAQYAPAVAAKIVAAFQLPRIDPNDRQWGMAVDRAGGVGGVKQMWGRAGRPLQFRLKNGGQFEYFYLIVAEDGFMYLVAEYAYG